MSDPVVKLLLDSGAYSAYTQKQPIDISKYADFVLKYKQHLFSAVNLDFIGPADVTEAAEKSLQNFLYLKDRGIVTMPVFHSGEPVKYLDLMLKEADYIGLSSSMVSMAEAERWYNLVFDYATDKNGFPIAKFHAFGDTTPQALYNYPWYSADSTTWVIAAGMAGRIFIKGSPIQFRSRTAKDFNFLSDEDIGVKRSSWADEFVRYNLDPDKCMKTAMRESDIMLIRTYINACHFLDMQEKTRKITRYTGPSSIITEKKYGPGIESVNPTQIFFVITSSTASRALAVISHLKITNVLISNFYIEQKQWEEMLIPYLYDPQGITQSNTKIKKEYDFLAQFLIDPMRTLNFGEELTNAG